MKEWAFQIRVPTIPWQKLFTKQTVFLLVFLGSLVGSYIYWAKQVRPYLHLGHATLCVSTFQLYANDTGRIVGKLWEEGEQFHQNEVLFSVIQEKATAMQRELELRLKGYEEIREREKGNLEEAMHRYVQLQSDGVPAEVIERVLVDVQEAQAKMLQAEEDCSVLRAEKIALENSRNQQAVVAPFDGMVLRCSKHLGEMVGSGEAVLSVLNPQQLWLESEISEAHLAQVKLGTSAVVQFPSYPGKEWSTQVSWVSPVVEKGRIKIRLTGENLPVRPGLSAQVSLRVR